jgi:hypothetical protein
LSGPRPNRDLPVHSVVEADEPGIQHLRSTRSAAAEHPRQCSQALPGSRRIDAASAEATGPGRPARAFRARVPPHRR